MYERLAEVRNDTKPLQDCVQSTVDYLLDQSTSTQRPGMLLGKIQSGKTNAFLGVIALAFDKGFDVAIILTKGTVSLARQTLKRVQKDFRFFIDRDQVQVYDIMSVPDLTRYELNQKLILVVKKEDDNLKRLLTFFTKTHPDLKLRKVLFIDDEADFASLSFRKKKGEAPKSGVIAGQIDSLRGVVDSSAVLQVTATPYALYLQPELEEETDGTSLFVPKRPAFTVILPVHQAYVGGDYYFDQSGDPDSPAYYFYEPVSGEERETLKLEDRRRFKIENVLTDRHVSKLRQGLACFILGASIRRWQQDQEHSPREKYSFLFHTEQSRSSHSWQERIARELNDQFATECAADSALSKKIFREAYDDLCRSLEKSTGPIPPFHYGRNPKTFQQDTVLQHSRMYGARHKLDLPVTRFYAPLHVYQVMKKIHEFDSALREAFESGAHERGVYFILRDAARRIAPCSPNKLLFSKLTFVRAGGRLLPVGFQTVSKTLGRKALDELDTRIRIFLGGSLDGSAEVDLERAEELLDLAHTLFDWPDDSDETQRSQPALLEHLSRTAKPLGKRGKVLLLCASKRDITRIREEGRFSDAPDTKQQRLQAQQLGAGAPALVMLREDGKESQGWRDLPFWWPVVIAPSNAPTAVFADQKPEECGGSSELPTC